MSFEYRMRLWVRAAVFSLCAAGAQMPALAQADALQKATLDAADRTVSIAVPSQPIEAALNEFARQSGVHVVIDSRIAEGLSSTPVQGSFKAEEALTLLLRRTGLTYRVLDERTVSVVKPGAASSSGASAVSAVPDLRLASVQTSDSENGEAQAFPEASVSEETDGQRSKAIPEILVKGARSLNMDIKRSRDDALPFVVFNRGQMERSSASNIDEFLKYQLPMAAPGTSSNQIAGGISGASSAVNLRGLGANQTLILIDGHRTSSVSFLGTASQPDLNGIPLSAIERIEILPTSASGIYGGGATGGVINVVMRRDYAGIQTQLRYDGTFQGGGARRRADISAGFTLGDGRTQVLMAGSYADSNPLLMGDRDFLRRGRARLLENNPQAFSGGFYPVLGSTTNICSSYFGICAAYYSVDIPLALKSGPALGGATTFVPVGYAGVGSDNGAQLAANAGRYNLAPANTAQAFGARNSLLNDPQIESVSATVRREFTPRIEGFLAVSAASTRGNFMDNSFGTFEVPGSAPGNPFVQDVVVTTATFGADSAYASTLRNHRALAGIIMKLGDDWQGALDYTWDRTRRSASEPPSALSPSATAAIASGAIDLFRDTNIYAVDFSSYLDPASRPFGHTADVTLNDATLRLSGPLGLTLPGGPLVLTGLLEHRRETLSDASRINPGISEFYYPSRWQTVRSAYIETRLPWVSERNARRGLQELELTLAVRHDRYETIGANTLQSYFGSPLPAVERRANRFNSTDPTLSVKLRPMADVQLRASYGTGFLPPAVQQIVPSFSFSDLTPYTVLGVVDPLRGNGPVGDGEPVMIISGGNPDLEPETSRSASVGIVLMPRLAPGLRASFDWVSISKKDNISNPFLATAAPGSGFSPFDYEQRIPGLVIRAPSGDGFEAGPVVAINNKGLLNVTRQKVEALDIAVDYRRDTASLGAWTVSAAATKQLRNALQLLPGSAMEELAGLYGGGGGLEWNGNASLDWEYRQLTLGWQTSYFHSQWLEANHAVDVNQGSARIPSQVYHDVFARYGLSGLSLFGNLESAEVQVGIQNLFDRSPPFNARNAISFYDFLGDPRLRRYSISLVTRF